MTEGCTCRKDDTATAMYAIYSSQPKLASTDHRATHGCYTQGPQGLQGEPDVMDWRSAAQWFDEYDDVISPSSSQQGDRWGLVLQRCIRAYAVWVVDPTGSQAVAVHSVAIWPCAEIPCNFKHRSLLPSNMLWNSFCTYFIYSASPTHPFQDYFRMEAVPCGGHRRPLCVLMPRPPDAVRLQLYALPRPELCKQDVRVHRPRLVLCHITRQVEREGAEGEPGVRV